jgi:hypothetical protein
MTQTILKDVICSAADESKENEDHVYINYTRDTICTTIFLTVDEVAGLTGELKRRSLAGAIEGNER